MWGFPYSRLERLGRTIAPFVAPVMVAVGVGMAVLALTTILWGSPTLSYAADPTTGVITHVVPGSWEWTQGLREGDLTLDIVTDPALGWTLIARDPAYDMKIGLSPAADAIRSTLPLALLALGLSALSVAYLGRSPARAEGFAAMAAIAAQFTLAIASPVAVMFAAGVASMLLPGAWLARHVPWRAVRWASAAIAVALVAAWLATIATSSATYDQVETVRTDLTRLAGIAILGWQLDRAGILARLREIGGLRAADTLAILGAVAIALVLELAVRAPPIAILAVLLVAVALYPRWRRAAAATLNRWLFRATRERMALAAVEAERGKIARDLHDVPLQELSGVIRRLERVPGTQTENETLREVADHLRSIATELRPPVIDDLGLGPALEFIAGRAARLPGGPDVEYAVVDEVEPWSGDRLPPDVELSVFRIVQEALGNAVRHSRARRVAVTGRITAHRVDVTVRDDGVGITPERLEGAIREGHMGVESMRQRAEAVGGTLDLRSSEHGGLEVRVVWAS